MTDTSRLYEQYWNQIEIADALDTDSKRADKFRRYISEDETYGEHNDEIDTTVYIVENAIELDNPFPMTELIKVENDEPMKENFGWPLAHIYQRDGDFPLDIDELNTGRVRTGRQVRLDEALPYVPLFPRSNGFFIDTGNHTIKSRV